MDIEWHSRFGILHAWTNGWIDEWMNEWMENAKWNENVFNNDYSFSPFPSLSLSPNYTFVDSWICVHTCVLKRIPPEYSHTTGKWLIIVNVNIWSYVTFQLDMKKKKFCSWTSSCSHFFSIENGNLNFDWFETIHKTIVSNYR